MNATDSSLADDPLAPLLRSVADGDRRAFFSLVKQTEARLYAVCLRVLHDRDAAQSALAEAYVKVWRYAERFRGAGVSGITWMVAIARHGAVMRLRRRDRPREAYAAHKSLAQGKVRQRVAALKALGADGAAIAALSDADRALLEAAYFGGLSAEGMAAEEGISADEARTAIARLLSAVDAGNASEEIGP